jgi:hypothetical protein
MKKRIRSWILNPIIVVLNQRVAECEWNLAKCVSEYDKEYWLGKLTGFRDSARILETYRSGILD